MALGLVWRGVRDHRLWRMGCISSSAGLAATTTTTTMVLIMVIMMCGSSAAAASASSSRSSSSSYGASSSSGNSLYSSNSSSTPAAATAAVGAAAAAASSAHASAAADATVKMTEPSMTMMDKKQQQQPLVPALIVFGDSTVDVGMNNNLTTLVKANFLPYGRDFLVDGKPTGRFCNGKVPTDFVASSLGIPTPLAYFNPQAHGNNIIQGINFASSASGYNDNTAKFFNVLSLSEQLKLFKNYRNELATIVGDEQASYRLSRGLYLLSTGSNDYVNNYFFNLRLKNKLKKDEYQQFLLQNAANFMKALYNLGARKLVVVSLPPLGCLPTERTILGRLNLRECVEGPNQVATTFNKGLQDLLKAIQAQHSDYKILYLDAFTPTWDIYHNPTKYGINNVQRGCCSSGTVEIAILCNRLEDYLTCKDASQYMWWDGLHPTEEVYKILSHLFVSEILTSNIL